MEMQQQEGRAWLNVCFKRASHRICVARGLRDRFSEPTWPLHKCGESGVLAGEVPE